MPGGESSGTWALVAGGGTAGHLLPGLALARALVQAGRQPSSIHFVGSLRGPEGQAVPAAGFTVDLLPGRGLQRRVSLATLAAAFDLVRALGRGIALVRRHRPSVVVVLGGYASLACGIGAVLCRVPLVLLEQNVRAGAVNRLLRPFAKASAVSFEGTDLPRAVVIGNPLRPEIRAVAENPDPAGSRAALGLPPDRTVIAVFAGSLGSRRINQAVAGLVTRWGDRNDLAIRHVVGKRDFESYMGEHRAELAAGGSAGDRDPGTEHEGGLVYQPVAYEDDMHLLLDAADLAVTRAGGGVFELMAVGLPAVLVPLPIATRDHQSANASAVAASGGAVVVADHDLTPERLGAELSALLDDRARLADMAQAMRAAAHLDAAEQAARLVEGVARD